jgi:HK97 family phage portal protein
MASMKAIEAIPGWYNVAKKAGELYGTIDAYEKVPMLYRAINLRSDALGTVPFVLERNDVPVDYPFVTPMDMLIQETERALLLTGNAFWLRLYRGRVLYGFQFLNPKSVTVEYKAEYQTADNILSGLRFSQNINGTIYGPWTIDQIVYWREPSIRDDVYGGVAPASVALQSAQLAYYLERFTSAFFEHGAQPAVIMSLDKSITPPEYERLKSDWRSRVENVSNAFKTFFFRGEVKTQILTFPLKDMELVPLQERVTTNITTTFGVPRTMLEASAANYATADSDRQSFWRETIVPRLAFYQRVLNQQVFAPLKYKMHFTPEVLDVFQNDEAARAGSLLQLVQAGVPLSSAMKILGYDNIDEAIGMPPTITGPDVTGVNVDSGAEIVDESLNDMKAVQASRLADLEAYERKALKRYKTKGNAAVTFESDVLPRYMTDYIYAELKSVKKKSDIAHVFHFIKALTLADLTPAERKVYNAIASKLATRSDKNAEAIARGDYTAVDTDLRNLLTDNVAQLVLDAGAQRIRTIPGMANVVGDQVITQGIANHANTYIDSYWNPFLQDLSATEQGYISSVIANAQTTIGITVDDIKNQLAMFGDLRAQRIAFTEPTRAAAQQTFAIQNQALQAGINTTMIWIAENDSTTCDICLPLDRLLQDQWPPEVSAGPPAHVNCRCAIGLQLVKSPIIEPEAGTIDVVADPNATPPPVPLLQRSAADIADYIISEVPAIAKAEYDTLQQLKSEADALYIQFNTSTDLATRITAGQQYNAKLKEIDKQQKAYHKAEAKTFDAVLPQLQSATPQQVTLQFNATFTAAQQAEIRKYVELTAGIAKQQTNGNPIVIYVEPNKDRNAYGTYDFATQILSVNKSSPTRTIVHETLHAMQHQLKYGVAETDSYGDSRTSGKAITQPNGYPVYTGITDNDYAYRVYAPFIQNNVGKWCEILTTTIHNIAGWDRVQDRSIIELATQIIKDNN